MHSKSFCMYKSTNLPPFFIRSVQSLSINQQLKSAEQGQAVEEGSRSLTGPRPGPLRVVLPPTSRGSEENHQVRPYTITDSDSDSLSTYISLFSAACCREGKNDTTLNLPTAPRSHPIPFSLPQPNRRPLPLPPPTRPPRIHDPATPRVPARARAPRPAPAPAGPSRRVPQPPAAPTRRLLSCCPPAPAAPPRIPRAGGSGGGGQSARDGFVRVIRPE